MSESKTRTEGATHKFILRILRSFCPEHLTEEIEGDLIQSYQSDLQRHGSGAANRKLLWNTIRFFRPGILLRRKITYQFNAPMVFKNHLKMAMRNFARQSGFSTINVVGLASGITCAVLIVLWIQNELSYDRFHPQSDRLFEAWNRDSYDGGIKCWSTTPKILAPTLNSEYPEVEDAVSYADYQMEFLVSKGDTKFTDKSGVITSTPFLSMFGFPLAAGDPTTALNDPFSIVMTESFAKRLFGEKDALNENVLLRYGADQLNFTVTGVLKDLPNNTAFDFNYLLSWELMRVMGENDVYWGNNSVMTFVKLKPGVPVNEFNNKIKDIVPRHTEGTQKNEIFLYPISQLWLYSKFVNGIPQGGRIEVVRLFCVIGFFIILISCINFMNLSTARYENRAKEVGVRKTIGAGHRSLIAQFLVESLFIAFVAGVIALIAVHLLLPYFNVLTEKQLTINYNSLEYWSVMFGVAIFAGLVAGSYPAFFLSSFKPVLVLKGTYISNRSSVMVRRALVVFQYAFTIILAIAALVIREQINFTQERETGFLKDRLIYHTISGDLNKNYAAYREELISSGVATSVSKTYSPIIEQWSSTPGIQWQGKDPSSKIIFDRFGADEDLVATAGLQLIAGRDIDLSRFPSDSSAALINEAAAQVMNFDNPVGERFTDSGKEWTIVGVIKDFIARSPYQKPAPMVIEGSKIGWFYVIHVRLSEDFPLTALLEKASTTFKKHNPEYPFEYHFADVEFGKKFSDEKRIQRLATASTSLAIIISCLGILGLSIHIAHKRTKEIGIRKVFGATTSDVINLLLREPVRLIAISFVIAVPVTLFLMEEWLERFHYKIDIPMAVFVFVGVGILAMSLLTIGVQTVKSSLTNPTKTLRQH